MTTLFRITVTNPGGEYTGNFCVESQFVADALARTLRANGYAGLVSEENQGDAPCPTCGHTHTGAIDDCWTECQECQDAQNELAAKSGHLEACGYTLKATGKEINEHLTTLVSPASAARAIEREKCGPGFWIQHEGWIVLGFTRWVRAMFEFDEGRPVLRRYDVDSGAPLTRTDVKVEQDGDAGSYWTDYAIDQLLVASDDIPWVFQQD